MNVIGVVLGGGRGERLYPLTKFRSKPAVPLGGKYRLVDIPVSNCMNSGINRIFVLTQFNSASLNRHISYTYRFDNFSKGFVDILAAEQTAENQNWFQGTADAVRKALRHFGNYGDPLILILAGDQLYQMDFRKMVEQHIQKGSDVTVAACTVSAQQANGLGILKTDVDSHIIQFHEKPSPSELPSLALNEADVKRFAIADPSNVYLASMGIYVSKLSMLAELLSDEKKFDFGKHIIPQSIDGRQVDAFIYDGYWEDIGTIRSYYQANLGLAHHLPRFDFYQEDRLIYSRARFLPPTRLFNTTVDHSLVADGCILNDSRISRSIIGLRTMVQSDSCLEGVVMLGADYYEWESKNTGDNRGDGAPGLGIGTGCDICNAIIDKNVRIGNNVKIRNQAAIKEADHELYHIRDGLVIIPKNTVIPPGMEI
jgi:glucose-1-phosphate adenylyltransferase